MHTLTVFGNLIALDEMFAYVSNYRMFMAIWIIACYQIIWYYQMLLNIISFYWLTEYYRITGFKDIIEVSDVIKLIQISLHFLHFPNWFRTFVYSVCVGCILYTLGHRVNVLNLPKIAHIRIKFFQFMFSYL